MAEPTSRHDQTNNALHRNVYRMLLGLAVWFVISIWLFFGGTNYIVLTLGVITFFLAFVTGIPTLLLKRFQVRAGEVDQPSHEHDRLSHEDFSLWNVRPFRTWTDNLPGRAAATEILLPIAAVAFGMTIIGLVYSRTSVPHLS
jgi:hypothetical protein